VGSNPTGPTREYPQVSGQGLTYGAEALTNHSSQTVMFHRVGLRDHSRNLKVLGTYLMPGDRYLTGVWGAWPPKLTGSGLAPLAVTVAEHC
jgi:hypothetical protein